MSGLMKDPVREAARAVRPGEHILAAVSGGADSIALLRILAALRDEGLIRLSAAHFEHGIRGEESLADMRFVQEICAQLSLELLIGRGDVPAESLRRRTGLEQTARDMRRAFLLDMKGRIGADAIALAHHADDQAETLLMHLLRGSGGRGACGMRERDGAWLRPLLHCRKQSLIDYLAQGGYDWREDATNAQEITPRNSLRLGVMPGIEEIFPGAVSALGRFAKIAQRENDFLSRLAAEWLGRRAKVSALGVRVPLDGLPDEAVLARAMKLIAGQEARMTDIDRLCGLCLLGRGRLDLRGEYIAAEAAGGEIWFTKEPEAVQKLPITLPGATKIAGLGTLWARAGEGRPVRNDVNRQELDAQTCAGAHLRLWQAGDRIRPLGMQGRSRLLSDVYADRGILPQRRRYLPVVEKDGEILWAVGACISETAKLRDGREAVRLEWEPDAERPWQNTEDDGGWDHEE